MQVLQDLLQIHIHTSYDVNRENLRKYTDTKSTNRKLHPSTFKSIIPKIADGTPNPQYDAFVPDGYRTTFKDQHDWFNQGTHIQILPNSAKGFKAPPGFRYLTQTPTFCKFTWDSDQLDGKAKNFQTFVIQLKYKAESVHIGYLTNAEMQSKLMYFDHYAFTDDCFNKTGGMSPVSYTHLTLPTILLV